MPHTQPTVNDPEVSNPGMVKVFARALILYPFFPFTIVTKLAPG
ncbi:hypothetical protein DW66_1554 [Pseudomonas putida]|nr:hypothetical protein DW66_1554 [Pseudomonas putida]